MNCPVSGDAGNAETGTLFQRHTFGKLNRLLQRNQCVFSGSAERAVTLSAVTPYPATDPLTRHTFADCIHSARTIAMGNHTRIKHPDPKGILAFLDVTRIYA